MSAEATVPAQTSPLDAASSLDLGGVPREVDVSRDGATLLLEFPQPSGKRPVVLPMRGARSQCHVLWRGGEGGDQLAHFQRPCWPQSREGGSFCCDWNGNGLTASWALV